jgi:hypothetical protein
MLVPTSCVIDNITHVRSNLGRRFLSSYTSCDIDAIEAAIQRFVNCKSYYVYSALSLHNKYILFFIFLNWIFFNCSGMSFVRNT